MVHAAATWIGLFCVGLLALHGVNVAGLALGAAVCAMASVYLFGVERASMSVMLSALHGLLGRIPDVVRGAAATVRAAAAADVTLRPALVQTRTRAKDDFSLGALVCAVSAAPGAVVVDAGDDSILAHVIEESDDSAAALNAIEAGVVRRAPRGSP